MCMETDGTRRQRSTTFSSSTFSSNERRGGSPPNPKTSVDSRTHRENQFSPCLIRSTWTGHETISASRSEPLWPSEHSGGPERTVKLIREDKSVLIMLQWLPNTRLVHARVTVRVTEKETRSCTVPSTSVCPCRGSKCQCTCDTVVKERGEVSSVSRFVSNDLIGVPRPLHNLICPSVWLKIH